MSVDEPADTAPLFTLGEYISALIEALSKSDSDALLRLQRVVGDRRARIILDDEAVDVFFDAERLQVLAPSETTEVNGIGETDSAAVLALLDGYLEVETAILNDRLEVAGAPEDITRMFTAIEILLDASSRAPALQRLAARFRRERRDRRGLPVQDHRQITWYPFGPRASEYELLAHFALL